MIRRVHKISAVLALAGSLFLAGLTGAQETPEPDETLKGPGAPVPADDKTFMESALQDALSNPDMRVEFSGLTGALSSSARVQRITISDKDGVWLTFTDAELDWTRSALLLKKVVVQKLKADKIILSRWPSPSSEGPKPEAEPFSLPQLPVSVDIGEVTAKQLEIDESIYGEPLVLSLDARDVRLADQVASANLDVARIDGKTGQLKLIGLFDQPKASLDIDLQLQEEKDGILVRLLKIPGAPSQEFSIKGKGQLSDLTTDISLKTDGVQRVNGVIRLFEPPEDPAEQDAEATDGQAEAEPDAPAKRQFSAVIQGDITSLVVPQYRSFFGEDVGLEVAGALKGDGSTQVDLFKISSAALNLEGEGEFASDGWPERLRLGGLIANADQSRVLLPFSEGKTTLSSARIFVNHDISAGPGWNALILANDLDQDGFLVGKSRFKATGELERQSGGAEGKKLNADVEFEAENVSHQNPAFAEALGQFLNGKADIIWTEGEPLKISGLSVQNEHADLALDGTIAGLETGLKTEGSVVAEVRDFQPFSSLANRPLKGRGTIEAKIAATLLDGRFDLEADGQIEQPSIAVKEADRLLAGTNNLKISAKRDEDGVALRTLSLSNSRLNLTADGQLKSDGSVLKLASSLSDFAAILPKMPGSVSISGTLVQSGDRVKADLVANGLSGTQLTIDGELPLAGTNFDLTAKGQAPLEILSGYLGKRQVSGVADINLRLQGPPLLTSLAGEIVTNGASFYDPDNRATLDGINGRISLASGQAQVALEGRSITGGTVAVDGPVTLNPSAQYPGNLAITLRNILRADGELYKTIANGELSVTGPLLGSPLLAGTIRLDQTEIRIQASQVAGLSSLPDITQIGMSPASRRTRQKAGLDGDQTASSGAAGPPIRLDLNLISERRIFVRGRGLDAELGGQLHVGGSTRNIIPTGGFNLVRGRLNLLGRRLDITEGLITMAGSLDPELRFRAQSEVDGTIVYVLIRGPASDPEVTFTSNPELPEEEVLSYLIFGRGIDQLSAFQAIKLAAGVAELTGRSTGVVSTLRDDLGLANLDIVTDEDGNAAVRAGRYLSENVYTDIQVGTAGTAELTINLDIKPGLTARGAVDTEGQTKFGIFFEKDY